MSGASPTRSVRLLVTLSGVDGAGKTTQIELLARSLTEAGRNVKVIWHRPGYSPLATGVKSFMRKVRPSALPTYYQHEAREAAFSSRTTRLLWTVSALLDSAI